LIVGPRGLLLPIVLAPRSSEDVLNKVIDAHLPAQLPQARIA
jgi:hypothetical protein